MLLGCIGDDFTGSTDLADTLVRHGMRAVQLIGVPDAGDPVPDTDAAVVALKSRTIPASEAIDQSVQALRWLREAGCRQFFFKYCSTFDSTDAGNIGPVAEALLYELDGDFTIACPSFPVNARTVYQGHLFVGDRLLNESGMEHHPLTPMTDADLVRVLDRQTAGAVGLVPLATVQQGPAAIGRAMDELRAADKQMAIVDAVSDADLHAIGQAVSQMLLITGGSGVARGLPENFRRAGALEPRNDAAALPSVDGSALVLSGSCSQATQKQVEIMRDARPSYRLDLQALAEGADVVGEAVAWAAPKLEDGPVLIYSTAAPDEVAAMQEKLGRAHSGELAEDAQAEIARRLVDRGVRKLVVAGGETSGAVVSGLGVMGLRIGAPIDPGVPWTVCLGDRPIALALKSGNFGGPDFFLRAFESAP